METRSVESLRKETQPPRRYTEASLLAAMETAGKDIEDAELREAMKESGIGTPATRASIIERLINVGYIERDGRALHATEKGIQVIRLLGEHPLTSAELTGDWERRLGLIERGEDTRPAFMGDIAKFTTDTVAGARQAQGRADRAGQARPLPGLRPRDHREPQGLLVLVERRPGLRLRDLEEEGGQVAAGVGGQGADRGLRASREAGEDPGVGRTAKQVTGFNGRSGRTFRAKLKLEQDDEGKWRVDFDEDWATGARAPAAGRRPRREGRDGGHGDGAGGAKRRRPSEERRARPRRRPPLSWSSRSRSTLPSSGGPVSRTWPRRPASRGCAPGRRGEARPRGTSCRCSSARAARQRQPESSSSPGSGPGRWVWPKITCSASIPSARPPRPSLQARAAQRLAGDLGSEGPEAGQR